MRMHGHSEHDSAKYVPRELLEEWKKKDPILYIETYLVGNQIAEKEELDSIDLRVKKRLKRRRRLLRKARILNQKMF